MSGLLMLRLQKLVYSALNPPCWSALAVGVAASLEHREVLAGLDTDLLLDVGANRGQFSLMTRVLLPNLKVHAFEPLPAEAAIYRRLFAGKEGVVLHEVALGENPGESELHVSARADSSSLLPIGDLQTKLFPSTREVGTCKVPVKTLDSLPELWSSAQRALLKLDVQGFELSVLRGARRALKHCMYVYVECSHVPLYTGQALYPEIEAFLAFEGFAPTRRHNEQWADRSLVQADYLFERNISANIYVPKSRTSDLSS